MRKLHSSGFVLASVVALSACGGSSDSLEPMSATFSLGVSDAPVNGANAVVVCFNEVELTVALMPLVPTLYVAMGLVISYLTAAVLIY